MRLIDADALMSGFDVRKVTEYDESGCGVDYKAVPVEAIENAPTIDAKLVRHGQWLLNMEMNRRVYPAERVHRGFKCSLCGRKVRSKKEPYCHCGAKMDGGADGE